MKPLTILFAIFALSSTLLADNYEITHQEVIPGAEGFTNIDPIIGSSGTLQGFVYTVPDSHFVAIDLFEADSLIWFHSEYVLKKSINRVAGDSVIVYVLAYNNRPIWSYVNPLIYSLVLLGDQLSLDTLSLTTNVVPWGGMVSYDGVVACNIHFDRDHDVELGLIFSHRLSYQVYDMTMGGGGGWVSTSHRVSLDLDSVTYSTKTDNLMTAGLRSGYQREFISAVNDHYYYKYNDEPSGSSSNSSTLRINDDSSGELYSRRMPESFTNRLFTGDFRSNYPNEEIIYFGRAPILLNSLDEPVLHLACYSCWHLPSSPPEMIWYLPVDQTDFSYVFRRQQVIAGMRARSYIQTVNYVHGTLNAPINLDRDLYATSFFELAMGDMFLNLVGRSHDTVFVYQFKTMTDAPTDNTDQSLPATTVLSQNYPNPFNGATVISFQLDHRQHVVLDIYNLLGRKVRTLTDGLLGAGTHQLSWDGKNRSGEELASGIYFGKLETGESSSVIKMLYLK